VVRIAQVRTICYTCRQYLNGADVANYRTHDRIAWGDAQRKVPKATHRIFLIGAKRSSPSSSSSPTGTGDGGVGFSRLESLVISIISCVRCCTAEPASCTCAPHQRPHNRQLVGFVRQRHALSIDVHLEVNSTQPCQHAGKQDAALSTCRETARSPFNMQVNSTQPCPHAWKQHAFHVRASVR
jgi:hypothetical protein